MLQGFRPFTVRSELPELSRPAVRSAEQIAVRRDDCVPLSLDMSIA
jgi:hypothetical protein